MKIHLTMKWLVIYVLQLVALYAKNKNMLIERSPGDFVKESHVLLWDEVWSNNCRRVCLL